MTFFNVGKYDENKMARHAAAAGWDSIQFLKGDGVSESACCSQLGLGTCCDSFEWVNVQPNWHGTYGCAEAPGGKSVRAGWKASRPCICNEKITGTTEDPSEPVVSYINCKGVPTKPDKSDTLMF